MQAPLPIVAHNTPDSRYKLSKHFLRIVWPARAKAQKKCNAACPSNTWSTQI